MHIIYWLKWLTSVSLVGVSNIQGEMINKVNSFDIMIYRQLDGHFYINWETIELNFSPIRPGVATLNTPMGLVWPAKYSRLIVSCASTERIKTRRGKLSLSDTREMQIRVEVKTESRLFPTDCSQGDGGFRWR